MVSLGLDRETKIDLGTIPNPPDSHVFLTDRGIDDWVVTYIDGPDVVYLDSSMVASTVAIPSGASLSYVGGGVWKLSGSVSGVIEQSGESSLATTTGALPIGNGGIWNIVDSSSSAPFDNQTLQSVLVTNIIDLPPDANGAACISDASGNNTPQLVGTKGDTIDSSSGTADVLFAGFQSSIFETALDVGNDDLLETRTHEVIIDSFVCPVPFQANNTVTSATQSLSDQGTETATQAGRTRFSNRDVLNTKTKTPRCYNAISDSIISGKFHKALQFTPTEIPEIGNNTLSVNITFPGTYISSGDYDTFLDLSQWSAECWDIFINASSTTCSGWEHPDLPDNDTNPNNINHWVTVRGAAVRFNFLNSGNSQGTTQTWNYSPDPEWSDFIGSKICWCVANGNQVDRYRGTITQTNPAPQTAGTITDTATFQDAASIENDIPGPINVTELTVELTSVETVDFDWHFENGIGFYHEDSIRSVPSSPSTCQMIANIDGSVSIIASAVAPTETDGEQFSNYFEKWVISANGTVSFTGPAQYNIYGMGTPDLDNTLAWDIGLL